MANSEDLRLFGLQLNIARQVYTTVVLMSVLVMYDGWGELATFVGVVAVIVAPVLAIIFADLFAEVLDAHSRLCRSLQAAEWRAHVRHQAHLFLSAVPPLLVLAVGWLSSMDPPSTITVLLWTGMATLVALSGLAAARAGLKGWRWLAASLSGGAIGLIIISLQIILKPH